jgi:lipopolysaccharide cholinephosphotransferase
VRDLNSLYIEHGDNFESDYLKGIYVDIFPFTKHPGISKSMIKKLAKGISKSNSILHHLHRYSLRSFAEFFWFGAQYYLYTGLWNLACCLVKSKRYANIPIINGYGITHERDQVLPVSVIKFEGLEFSAPHNPDQYLKNIYRNYMEIPPVEKRKFHSVYIQPELVKKD